MLSWNVRGLNWPNKQEDLRPYLHSLKVEIVGLMETKVKEDKAKKIIHTILPGWNWENNYEFSPKGRIWVTWKRGAYEVINISKSDQYIHYRVTNLQE